VPGARLAIRTVCEAYGYPLHEVFLPFCAEEGIEEPGQVTARVLDRHTTRLLDEGGRRGALSKFTVASYVRSINAFLSWARREGEVAEGVKAQAPKLPRRLLDVLSREEIGCLEDAAKTERDKLIVRVLADAGLRVTELTGLRLSDLIERDRRVRGKGGRERDVPVMPSSAAACAATSNAAARGARRRTGCSSASAVAAAATTSR